MTGKAPDRTGLMASLAASFTDPLVEKLIASATLTEIMRNGWTVSVLGERPPGFEGLDANALGNAWQLYFNADYGLGEVRFPVPVSKPKEKQFRVRLALNDWKWKLAGLDLPHDLQERLVREFIKQQRAQEKILGQLRRTDSTRGGALQARWGPMSRDTSLGGIVPLASRNPASGKRTVPLLFWRNVEPL